LMCLELAMLLIMKFQVIRKVMFTELAVQPARDAMELRFHFAILLKKKRFAQLKKQLIIKFQLTQLIHITALKA